MKEQINQLKEKHLVIFSILITLLYLIVLKNVKWLIPLEIRSNGYTSQLIAECAVVILSVIIMYLVNKNHILKEKGEGILKGLFIGGFLVIIILLIIIAQLSNVIYNGSIKGLLPTSQIMIFIFAMIGVGISEEFIFRGIILNLFMDKFNKTPKEIYTSVALSSIMFGLAHITNVFSGVSIRGASIQAIAAIMIGALLSAIYLRSKNIWVVVIIHTLMDFSQLINSGFFGTTSMTSQNQVNNYTYIKLIGCLIYLIPALFLLRKKKLLQLIEHYK